MTKAAKIVVLLVAIQVLPAVLSLPRLLLRIRRLSLALVAGWDLPPLPPLWPFVPLLAGMTGMAEERGAKAKKCATAKSQLTTILRFVSALPWKASVRNLFY